MKHVFGPVPSRRLGQSLGIDPIPLKTCNWNCVYCQLGRTVPLTNERRDYFPTEEILHEIENVLESRANKGIDWITFVGSGEPTLHSHLGKMIRRVKLMTSLPVAVITNGALLFLPEIRADLSSADAILPTLDAGKADLYRKINRPHPEITFERFVNGLIAFRSEYHGKLWVEIMLVRGLNDSKKSLEDIAKILRNIKPNAIHINLPTRPPCETWVQPPNREGLMRAISILGKSAEVVHPAQGSFELDEFGGLAEAIIGIITRHPMRQDELELTLNRWSPEKVETTLAELENSGKVQIVERYGTRFWSTVQACYPTRLSSDRTIPKP